MIRKLKKKDKVNFLLENKHYQRLHLILYFLSVLVIVMIYFLTLFLFSRYVNLFLTSVFSLIIGVWLVYNRDKIVKKIDDIIQEKKRKKLKQEEKQGLKKTLKRISPKNHNLKLDIKSKIPIKEKIKKIIDKTKKNKKKASVDYIEIKD